MRKHLMMFGLGIVFAVGLGISGMTLPAKVIGFLDVAGAWDPALVFVMGGAVVVFGLGYPMLTRRESPLFAPVYLLPTRTDITPRLVGGAVLFGVGWGASGFCPGPALTSMATGATPVLLFVGGMVMGMFLFQAYDVWVSAKAKASAAPSSTPAAPPNGAKASPS